MRGTSSIVDNSAQAKADATPGRSQRIVHQVEKPGLAKSALRSSILKANQSKYKSAAFSSSVIGDRYVIGAQKKNEPTAKPQAVTAAQKPSEQSRFKTPNKTKAKPKPPASQGKQSTGFKRELFASFNATGPIQAADGRPSTAVLEMAKGLEQSRAKV